MSGELNKTRPEPEVVLPNGVFAKLRRITWLDVATALLQPPAMVPMVIAQRCCTFDGVQYTMEQIHAPRH